MLNYGNATIAMSEKPPHFGRIGRVRTVIFISIYPHFTHSYADEERERKNHVGETMRIMELLGGQKTGR